MPRTNLYGANLTFADFTKANLGSAMLQGANLTSADFTKADLSFAMLQGANLAGAKIQHAILKGAKYNAATTWPDGFLPITYGVVLDRPK